MGRLYVICGHGAGDPGACGNGYQEAERVRALGRRIKELGGSDVVLLDTSRNWYADAGIDRLSVPDGSWLVELHMDNASSGARGGHVIIKAGIGGADKYDRALAKSIASIFPGRSKTIVERDDLANPNRAAARGINYRLVENGFISNAKDVKTFNSRLSDLARAYLDAFGLKGGKEPEGSEEPDAKPSTAKKKLGKVDIQYALRKASDNKWWDWVKNFENRTSEGYAGAPYTRHNALKAKVTKGSIKYRVRNGVSGVWTPWHKNGEVASVSKWIDLVEMYYTTPSGYAYQQVWYRAQTTERSGWLPVVCDSGDSIAGYTDGNAGWAGEPLDRLQAKIGDGDPF